VQHDALERLTALGRDQEAPGRAGGGERFLDGAPSGDELLAFLELRRGGGTVCGWLGRIEPGRTRPIEFRPGSLEAGCTALEAWPRAIEPAPRTVDAGPRAFETALLGIEALARPIEIRARLELTRRPVLPLSRGPVGAAAPGDARPWAVLGSRIPGRARRETRTLAGRSIRRPVGPVE
jgi:hypothetical protein